MSSSREDSAGVVVDRAALIRRLALTAEQRERRLLVARRSEGISRGVTQPRSGVWGKPPGSSGK